MRSYEKIKELLEKGEDPSKLLKGYINTLTQYDEHLHSIEFINRETNPEIYNIFELLINAGATPQTIILWRGLENDDTDTMMNIIIKRKNIGLLDYFYKNHPELLNNESGNKYTFIEPSCARGDMRVHDVLFYLYGISIGIVNPDSTNHEHKNDGSCLVVRGDNSLDEYGHLTELEAMKNIITEILPKLTRLIDIRGDKETQKNLYRYLLKFFTKDEIFALFANMYKEYRRPRPFESRKPLLAHRENYIESVNKARGHTKRKNNLRALAESIVATAYKEAYNNVVSKELGYSNSTGFYNTRKGGRRRRRTMKKHK
jgi:hypothetical protein